MGVGWRSTPPLAVLAILACLFAAPAATGEPSERNVLVLFSASNRRVFTSLDVLRSELAARVTGKVNVYEEHFESERFYDERFGRGLEETLRHAYGAGKLDLIIVDGYPALQFLIKHRDSLFSQTPVIFYDVDNGSLTSEKLPPDVTGVLAPVDVHATVALALHLHPQTDTVAVISGNSTIEKYWLAAVHNDLLNEPAKVNEIDLVGIQPSLLMERVAGLPPNTVVLFQDAPPQESVEGGIGDYDVLAWIGQKRPTYCIFPAFCLDHGAVGGVGYDGKEQISLAADQAKRVLAGERPEDIPVTTGSGHEIRVDWRELRHWNIPETALPPGTRILYRDLTPWERYRKYILAALAVIAIQSLLIAGLMWERMRKRKAEAALRESEKRFRVMADTTPAFIWMCDPSGKITYLNDRRLSFSGQDLSYACVDGWKASVHPEDLEKLSETITRALLMREGYSTEYRLRRRDGVYRWMFDVASPRIDGNGTFAGLIGSAVDVTDQKTALEALEKLSGRLIEAQEKERKRIARELHDDIAQQIALLWLELDQTRRSPDGLSEGSRERVEKALQQCTQIAHDIHALSHELHSSKLEYLGVVAAIRGFCREFSKQHEVSIEFRDENVPEHLPNDVSLCLFRVAQEALHNAQKYSNVRQFSVHVSCAAEEVRLIVSDGGVGFDVAVASIGGGLGLVSMQERVHLVHGRLTVESKPGGGTTITASVPVPAESRQASQEREWNRSMGVSAGAA